MRAETKATIEIIDAETPAHIAAVRELFLEYAASLGFSLCFQSFEQELAELPGKYAPPAGRLLLGMRDGQPVGCVALHALTVKNAAAQGDVASHVSTARMCEMKRLYMRPEARGLGLGRKLAEHLIAEARAIGYTHMRLDTVPGVMDNAIALYRRLGFREIAPYCHNPVAGAICMELTL